MEAGQNHRGRGQSSACEAADSATSFNAELSLTTDKPKPAKQRCLGVISTTSPLEKEELDRHVAKFFISTNTPFNRVEHPQFKELISKLRPSYKPPGRKLLGGVLLDKVHNECMEVANVTLDKQVVTLSLDGWSNIHNEPIVCIAATAASGDVYLLDTVDTSGNPHTAEYLKTLVQDCLEKYCALFNFRVCGFVTDNAGNVSKIRRQLQDGTFSEEVLEYGCGAHILNLLCKDLHTKSVTDKVLTVVKYFRNTHLPGSWLRNETQKKLQLPSDTRWNSMYDALQCYLEAWPTFFAIADKHRLEMKSEIYSIFCNLGHKRFVEDMLNIYNPISVAIDKMQSSRSNLSDAVKIWIDLTAKLNEVLPTEKQCLVAERKAKSNRSSFSVLLARSEVHRYQTFRSVRGINT